MRRSQTRSAAAYGASGLTVALILAIIAPGCGAEDNPSYRLKLENWDGANDISATQFSSMFDEHVLRELTPVSAARDPVTLLTSGRIHPLDGETVLDIDVRLSFPERSIPLELHRTTLARAGSGDVNREALAHNALADLREALKTYMKIYEGTPDVWRYALGSRDSDVQILALRLLARHEIKGAARSIVPLLSSPVPRVSDEAVDALGALRVPDSVPWILAISSRADLQLEARGMQSIAEIGGVEAVAYLEMVAGGHESDEMRRMSSNLLKRLKNRH